MTPVPKTVHVGEVGNTCEAGGFCLTTTKYPLPCTPGNYQPLQGMKSDAACVPCPCGYFCDGRVDATRTDIKKLLTYLKDKIPAPDKSGPCEAGYYCTGSAKHARQFEAIAGKHAPMQSATQGAC